MKRFTLVLMFLLAVSAVYAGPFGSSKFETTTQNVVVAAGKTSGTITIPFEGCIRAAYAYTPTLGTGDSTSFTLRVIPNDSATTLLTPAGWADVRGATSAQGTNISLLSTSPYVYVLGQTRLGVVTRNAQSAARTFKISILKEY